MPKPIRTPKASKRGISGMRSHPDPDTRNGRRVSRRNFLKGIGIACLGFAPFLQSCNDPTSIGGKGGGIALEGAIAGGQRPPIDIAAPSKTETATFALG
ncbi:MAG: twin-arginine translocation signal domain-containing protein [Thermodesulfobacteriota bacterium]